MDIKFEICSTNTEYYPFKYHILFDDGDETYLKDGQLTEFLDSCGSEKSMTILYLICKEGSHKSESFPYSC